MNWFVSNPVLRRSAKSGRGFTLIEALFAVVLVGLAIAGLTAANIAHSQANSAAVDISTAEYLAGQIRELTATMNIDEIVAFRGSGNDWVAINPPIDANQNVLTAFSVFSQQMRVEPLRADLATLDTGSAPRFYRVTVRIFKGGREISSSSWIRARH
ncbi:MAG TPA: prepilin-type N-terminal cleavage/methylation domain-containing protein [Sedimentisphaerales bacterium]|nr:prepilin-type N-terminal cleavage/methylation domain-containing protein [Sedimentisphaerales bacterium]